MIVIDASATIALLLNEDTEFSNIRALSTLANEPLIAPSHWGAEIGNALVNNVRRHRLDRAEIPSFIERLEELGIEVDTPPTFADIATIAKQAIEAGLTFYDAAYVHAARSRQASLFTLDRKMREVATTLKVPLLPQ